MALQIHFVWGTVGALIAVELSLRPPVVLNVVFGVTLREEGL